MKSFAAVLIFAAAASAASVPVYQTPVAAPGNVVYSDSGVKASGPVSTSYFTRSSVVHPAAPVAYTTQPYAYTAGAQPVAYAGAQPVAYAARPVAYAQPVAYAGAQPVAYAAQHLAYPYATGHYVQPSVSGVHHDYGYVAQPVAYAAQPTANY